VDADWTVEAVARAVDTSDTPDGFTVTILER
jgi:hypothetical protein